MNVDWLTSTTALVSYGGAISALRLVIKDKNRSKLQSVSDITVGIAMAIGISDYLPHEAPKLALLIGLISGALASSLLDSFQAAAPNLAKGIISGIFQKFGYTKEHSDEDK